MRVCRARNQFTSLALNREMRLKVILYLYLLHTHQILFDSTEDSKCMIKKKIGSAVKYQIKIPQITPLKYKQVIV